MNDRYLYRAKRTDNEKWAEGFLMDDNYINTPFNDNDVGGRFDDPVEIDPSTICQCTGLKDKNGKLIWENDIVRFQFDNDDCPFQNKDTKKRIGKVFFSDFRASWSIAMGRKGSDRINNDLFKYAQNGNRTEVIGNNFDNPELLEVGE